MSYFYDHFDRYALNVAKKLGYSKADYIKSGDNGCAYDIGDDKVLKLTTDRNEAKNANKLHQKPITKHIVNYYDVREFKINEVESGDLESSKGMVHHVYTIVMDKIIPIKIKYGYTKDIRIWYEIKRFFFNTIYSNQDIRNNFFNEEQSTKDVINMFLEQRKSMLTEFRKYHIITNDFHLGNMGVDDEGNIVFFDVGAHSPYKTFGKKLKDIDLRESINPSDAYTLDGSVNTLVTGKRNVAIIHNISPYKKIFKDNGINFIRTKNNQNYIIFTDKGYENAKKLKEISDKYEGYFPCTDENQPGFTPNELYEIGILLEYDKNSVINFVNNMLGNWVDKNLISSWGNNIVKEGMFKPRNLDRWEKWNSEQSEEDGIKINQYDSRGLKQGKWMEYYDNGNLFHITNYNEDEVLNGPWILYHSNGSLNVVGGYIDGLRDGVWQYYRNYGEPTVYSIYKRGIKVVDGKSGEYKHKNSLKESTNIKDSEMSKELQHILSSKQFQEWLRVLGSDPTTLRQWDLTNGYCEDLAVYLHKKYGAKMCVLDDKILNDGHYFVELDGKYYDGINWDGVEKIEDLDWCKKIKFKGINLNKHLRFDWDGISFYRKYYPELEEILNKPINENNEYETTDEYPEQHMVEQYLSLEDIKKIANSLGYELKEKVGEGCYGCAYKLSDDKVLKLTYDYEEATNANYMRRKPITKHIVNYYDVRKINIPKIKSYNSAIYSIVMDYVHQPADEIKNVFSKMRVKFFNDGISNEELLKGWGIRKLDWSRDEMPVVKYLLSQRDGVLTEMGKYKMSTIDLHKNNLGFKNGSLVFFDIGGDTKICNFGKKLKPIVVENNLFKPRNLDRWKIWNSEQPIVDGKPINQYDKNHQKTGYWEILGIHGLVTMKGNFVNGKRDGYWKEYYIGHKNKLYAKGLFKLGIPTGEWLHYSVKGELMNTIVYS